MTKVGIAGLWHETNTYSARLTGLAEFAAFELLSGDEIVEAHQGTGSVVGGMLETPDLDLVPVATAGAWPGGRVTRSTLRHLLDRLREGLARTSPFDGLLLDLHGAMVAEGVDDVEAMAMALVREVVGEVPVVAVHDFHANPSPELVSRCTALVGYETYPHVDMRERGGEAGEILGEVLGGSSLHTMVRKVPVLICPLAQGTTVPPMVDLEARARELEHEPGIRRISLLPGFPYSDVARCGFSVVVTYAAGGKETAARVGDDLVTRVEAADWALHRPSPRRAVEEAIRSAVHPVVLVDVADNIGGGSPGDGTALLAELLAQGATGAVVSLADSEVAAKAHRLGVGATIEANVGGKTDRLHGDPVRIKGEVLVVSDGSYRTEGTWQTGRSFGMGRTVVVVVDGVTLHVMERPTPPFHREQLTSVGIDPAAATVITAKGNLAWRAAYGDVARRVIEVDTPGICPLHPQALKRTTTPMRV